ncbi:MAG TPA: hypothetical protein VF520_03700 [Thermoleophilaceae bacterium]
MEGRPLHLAAAALLSAAAVGAGGCGGGGEPAAGESWTDAFGDTPSVERVAKRVEAIRGLRFEEVPDVRVLSEEELEREQERALDEARDDSDERRRIADVDRKAKASVEAIKLLGLVDDDEELGDASSGSGGGGPELGGFYNFETRRVNVVDEAVADDPDVAETVLAHELTHALEHQHFGAKVERLRTIGGERSISYLSVQEGIATVVELEYAIRYLDLPGPRSRLLERSRFLRGSAGVPPAINDLASFPYRRGALFADAVLEEGGRRALGELQRRPPVSTEQVLHAERWRARDAPLEVEVELGDELGAGWALLDSDSFGEAETALILQRGGSRDEGAEAAAGWGGGRFQLWRRGGADADCESPCRDRTVLGVAWRWDTRADAREQAAAVPPYLAKALDGRPSGRGTWRIRAGSHAAFAVAGERSALVMAPSAGLATRLARRLAGT